MHKALLVDDERMIVNSLMLGFPWKEHGFEVVATASSGKEALALIADLRPDVVLTDVKMPAMSGLDLMEACRERAPDVVFIVISGHAEFAFAQKALKLGAVAYCLKPLENDEIAAALRKAKEQIAHQGALRNAALARFLAEPCAENAEALLAPYAFTGRMGVALSLGDASRILSGNVPCVRFSPDERCHLYLFFQDFSYLNSPHFRAALLSAVTSGSVSAFVFDETDAPAEYLLTRLPLLMDQLYAAFFAKERVMLGRAHAMEARQSAWLEDFAALCNKNRPNEALRALRDMPPEESARFAMHDAVRLHNLVDAMLSRAANLSGGERLKHGFELAARYESFSAMLAALCRRVERLLHAAHDLERLHNETLARVVREVNQSFTSDLSFQEICARHGINPSYLSQLFKKEMRITFTGYVSRLRVGYAKELLETTAILVSEISDRVGCDSYLTFTRLFKRETGMTPKAYRARSKRGV